MINRLASLVKLPIYLLLLGQLSQSQQIYVATPSSSPLTCSTNYNFMQPYYIDNCLFVQCSEWNILIGMVFNNRNNFAPCEDVVQKTTSPCRDHSYLFMHTVKPNSNQIPVHGSSNIDHFLIGLQASDSRPFNGVADLTSVIKAMNTTATQKLITRGVNRAIIMTDFSCQILCQDDNFQKTLLSTLVFLSDSGYSIDIHFVYGGDDDCSLFSSEFQKANYTFSQECVVPDAANTICNNRFANLEPPSNEVCKNFLPTRAPATATPSCELNAPNCPSWDIYYFIFTLNSQDLRPVAEFAYETVSACTTDSRFQLIVPNRHAYFMSSIQVTQVEVSDTIANLTPNDYLMEEALYVNVACDMLGAVKTDIRPSARAAALFFFTDLTCEDFCRSSYSYGIPDFFVETVQYLQSLKFVVKLFSLANVTGSITGDECAHIFQPIDIIPTSIPLATSNIDNFRTCSNYFYGDPIDETTTEAFSHYEMTTKAPKSDLSTSDVVWIVLGTILGVILCVLCLIKLICNCDGPREKMSRFLRGWLDKHDRKKFGQSSFFNKASGDKTGRMENGISANSYTDLPKLAAQNRDDAWELPVKNLFIHENEILGSGAFAQVFKGTVTGIVPLLNAQQGVRITLDHGLDEFCDAAVKRLPPHADEQNRLDFFHEMQFMKKLGYHVHVISMLGCVSDPEDPLILVEYCQHGDLLHFLRSNRLLLKNGDQAALNALRMKNLVSITWQISDGLSYLHSKNFVHRDIAARNVLLTRNMVAKISDFGLCRYIDSAMYTAKGGKLPIKWMAIESLKFYVYSNHTDIWAFAVTMWEIFTHGEGPFQAVQPLDVLQHLENGNRLQQPNECPKEIYELMCRCWKEEADDRPSAVDIKTDLMSMLY